MRTAVLFFAVMVAGCTAQPVAEPDIRTVGNFMDSKRNRVYSFAMRAGTDEATVREHARALPYTPGQITAAYYYPESTVIPADGITLAESYMAAINTIYDDPHMGKWKYVYMQSFSPGGPTFEDCTANPRHDLCNK